MWVIQFTSYLTATSYLSLDILRHQRCFATLSFLLSVICSNVFFSIMAVAYCSICTVLFFLVKCLSLSSQSIIITVTVSSHNFVFYHHHLQTFSTPFVTTANTFNIFYYTSKLCIYYSVVYYLTVLVNCIIISSTGRRTFNA